MSSRIKMIGGEQKTKQRENTLAIKLSSFQFLEVDLNK